MTLAISSAMRDLVGRPYRQLVSEPITLTEVTRWSRMVCWPDDPITPLGGADQHVPVPCDFNPFAWYPHAMTVPDPEQPDSFIEGLAGVVGPGATVGVNGELVVTYGVPMQLGDRISTASSVTEYRSRAGGPGHLLLTDVETVWRNQRHELVKHELNTVVRW
jgi:hypothetical protein